MSFDRTKLIQSALYFEGHALSAVEISSTVAWTRTEKLMIKQVRNFSHENIKNNLFLAAKESVFEFKTFWCCFSEVSSSKRSVETRARKITNIQ